MSDDEQHRRQASFAKDRNEKTEKGQEWSNGICGCFGDCKLCIITYIFPCYIAGRIAESTGESCAKYGVFAALPIANIIFGAKIRKKIRFSKNIGKDKEFGRDLVMHVFCPFCAYVQEAREVSGVVVEVDTAIDRQ